MYPEQELDEDYVETGGKGKGKGKRREMGLLRRARFPIFVTREGKSRT